MADETVAEQNRRKLAEHLARLQEQASKGERIQSARETAKAKTKPDPLQGVPKPPPPPPGWEAWKRAHRGRIQEVRYADAGAAAEAADLKLLGLKKGASRDDIRKAFARLAQEYHPDHGGDAEIYLAMQAAYQRLMK